MASTDGETIQGGTLFMGDTVAISQTHGSHDKLV